MIATSVILGDGMLGINQFFGVGVRRLNKGFRITPKAEVAS